MGPLITALLFVSALPVPADNALLKKGFLDATLYPGVDKTGVHDSRAGIQQALDDGYKYALAVYLPSGTYLVSGPLTEAQKLKPNYDQYSIPLTPALGVRQSSVLVGAMTPTRPRIVLADKSTGFGDASNPKAVLDFHAQDSTNTMSEEQIAPSGMSQVVRNLDIVVGSGNPGAVGLQLPSAQFSSIEDVHIDATGGYAGLRWVVTTNVMVNVDVTGGKYGVIADTCCGITFAGLTLRNQTDVGLVVDSSTTAVITGFDISETTATPIKLTMTTNGRGELSLHDGRITKTGPGTAIDNPYSRTIYMQNVFANVAGPLATSAGSPAVTVPTGTWQTIDRYVFAEKPGKASGPGGTTYTVSTASVVDGAIGNVGGLTLGAAADPPSDIVTRHAWVKIPWFDDSDAVDAHTVGVAGDGVTDDTDALQAAIDAHDKVFLPRGDYIVNKQLVLHAHTKLFGVPGDGTHIIVRWDPKATLTHALITDDDADADTYVGSLTVKIPGGYDNSFMGGIEWRAGRASWARQFFVSMPWEDPANGNQSAARSLVSITGHGGGRWFGLTAGDMLSRSVNPGARGALITGTVEPLTFYGFNIEHDRGTFTFEMKDAANVRVFGTKTENHGFMHCDNSQNILLTGIINRGDDDHSTLQSDDCDDVLAPNITMYSWEFGDSVPVIETFAGTKVKMPTLTECSVFSRGTFDPSVFEFALATSTPDNPPSDPAACSTCSQNGDAQAQDAGTHAAGGTGTASSDVSGGCAAVPRDMPLAALLACLVVAVRSASRRRRAQ